MSTVGGGGRGGRGGWWRCEIIMTNDCLILFIFLPVSRFRLHSVPVYSGEHSGLNSGMPVFHWNIHSLEWQYWLAPLPFLIPPDSTGIRWNDRIPAGICGA